MKKIFLPLLLMLVCLSTASADDATKRLTYKNPVIMSSTPDPCVIRANDGYFYLYGTEDMHNMPIYRSKNLVDWIFVGTAFTEETRPRTVSPYSFAGHSMMWAPDINYINGQYVLYYSIGVWNTTSDQCGVGVATSERPEGPFVDRGAIMTHMPTSTSYRANSSIDQFYIEEDGKKYLVWGSFNDIKIIQLTDDGLRIMPGATETKLAGNFMEGSYIYKSPDGYYYLFGSNGTCCSGASSTYRIVYGRSESLFGPYVTKAGRKMTDNEFEILLYGNDIVAGPGHNAEFVTDDNGDTWILYHGYLKSNPGLNRVVFLDQVKWKDGWPYIENSTPSQESVVPYFKK